MPAKYKNKIAQDKSSCVIGSVEGVSIALKIVANSKIYLHDSNIWFEEIMFMRPSTICIIGTWNANPVLNNNNNIKSKYCSNDQRGSTISEPYWIKKFNAAGINTLKEKYIPAKNKHIEVIKIGRKNLASVVVNPGRMNNTIW